MNGDSIMKIYCVVIFACVLCACASGFTVTVDEEEIVFSGYDVKLVCSAEELNRDLSDCSWISPQKIRYYHDDSLER